MNKFSEKENDVIVEIDTENMIIDVKSYSTGIAIYHKLKSMWRVSTELIKYEFPMVANNKEYVSLMGGWNITEESVKYIGGCTLSIFSYEGDMIRKFVGIKSIGSDETWDGELLEVQGEINYMDFIIREGYEHVFNNVGVDINKAVGYLKIADKLPTNEYFQAKILKRPEYFL